MAKMKNYEFEEIEIHKKPKSILIFAQNAQ